MALTSRGTRGLPRGLAAPAPRADRHPRGRQPEGPSAVRVPAPRSAERRARGPLPGAARGSPRCAGRFRQATSVRPGRQDSSPQAGLKINSSHPSAAALPQFAPRPGRRPPAAPRRAAPPRPPARPIRRPAPRPCPPPLSGPAAYRAAAVGGCGRVVLLQLCSHGRGAAPPPPAQRLPRRPRPAPHRLRTRSSALGPRPGLRAARARRSRDPGPAPPNGRSHRPGRLRHVGRRPAGGFAARPPASLPAPSLAAARAQNSPQPSGSCCHLGTCLGPPSGSSPGLVAAPEAGDADRGPARPGKSGPGGRNLGSPVPSVAPQRPPRRGDCQDVPFYTFWSSN